MVIGRVSEHMEFGLVLGAGGMEAVLGMLWRSEIFGNWKRRLGVK